MYLPATILGFFSGQDALVIFVFVISIPVGLMITVLAFASKRRNERMAKIDSQTVLLNEILQELKKLNAAKK